MNILQIIPELKTGGVETGTVDIAKELVKDGHNAIVISNGGPLLDELVKAGVKHYKLPVHEKSPITVISMIPKIKEIIAKEDIDIVHARSRVPAISAFFAARSMKRPFITTCHGHYSTHIFSRVMSWGKLVIVASNVMARHMIEKFQLPRERVRFIPRGVDLNEFSYRKPDTKKKKEYTIGIVGRITPIKGHIYLIRAMSKVIRLMPNIKLLIIGDAPESKPKYRQELEVLIRRLSLSKYIHFLGDCKDVPKKMKELDLLVMPSIGEETFGRVIIEAQASGVPVVASRIGGIVDIIRDNENGILINPRDYSSLSEAIVRVLKDEELSSKLSKNGRDTIEKNFTLTHMYKRTLKVYMEVLDSFKILIIKWSALGDILLSLPAMAAIRKKFPKAKILLLTSKAGRDIVARYPYVDEFIIYNKKKSLKGVSEIIDISSQARKEEIDVSLDLQNNKKSHMLSYFSFAKRRIGYKSRKLDFFLNEAIDDERIPMPPIKHQFKLLKTLGIDPVYDIAQLKISEKEDNYACALIREGWVANKEILIGINCGASQRWQTKRWSTEKMAKLCDILAQNNIRVIITGSKEDTPFASKISMLTRSKPLNVTGKTTLMELAALIKHCRVFVTSDSAPMHLASFLKIPFVAIFGPTDPKRHLQAEGEYRLIYKKPKCSPCYNSKCKNRICMDEITPEEVSVAITELLKEKS